VSKGNSATSGKEKSGPERNLKPSRSSTMKRLSFGVGVTVNDIVGGNRDIVGVGVMMGVGVGVDISLIA